MDLSSVHRAPVGRRHRPCPLATGVALLATMAAFSAAAADSNATSQTADNSKPCSASAKTGSQGNAQGTTQAHGNGQSPCLQTVVVTGKRVDELGLQKDSSSGSRLDMSPLLTPGTVQTITSDAISERLDFTMLDVESQAPGMTTVASPGNGNSGLSYRGFSGVTSVMQLYDGIQLGIASGTVTFPFDTWNVDRVEVLGGPSSVLYGVGAIGGTVNVVTRKPNTTLQQDDVQVGAGSFGTYREALDSTGPINDALSYRFDVSNIDSDGWVDRGHSSSIAASGTVQLQASDNLRFALTDDFGRQEPMGYYGTPLVNGRPDPAWQYYNFNVGNAEMQFIDNWTQFKTDWTPADNLTVHDDLYLLTSHRIWHDLETYTYEPASDEVLRSGYYAIFHHETQVGDEANVTFKSDVFGLPNEVEGGFDINTIGFEHINNSPYGGSSLVDPNDFDPGLWASPDPTRPGFHSHTQEQAIFAEDRLTLIPQVTLVAGARYDRASLQYDNFTVTNGNFYQIFRSPTWRLGTVYTPLPGLAFYGQYSIGTAPLSSLVTASLSQDQYKLENGRQYELGVKQSFWESKGEWTLAHYRIVENNVLTPDPINPAITEQIGQQSSDGWEASLALSLGWGWDIQANGTVMRALYDNYSQSVSGVAVSRDGDVPTNIPEHTANVFASWTFASRWRLRGGWQSVGRRYLNAADQLWAPPYNLYQFGARWFPTKALWLDVSVDNAFSKLYAQEAGSSQWILGAPRSVEGTVNWHF